MLERAIQMPTNFVGRPDGRVAHGTRLAGGVQLVVLEVGAGVRRLVFTVQEPDGCFLTGQFGRRRSRTVVAWILVHHERDDWLLADFAHHPRWTTAGSGGATTAGPPRGSRAAASSPRVLFRPVRV